MSAQCARSYDCEAPKEGLCFGAGAVFVGFSCST